MKDIEEYVEKLLEEDDMFSFQAFKIMIEQLKQRPVAEVAIAGSS